MTPNQDKIKKLEDHAEQIKAEIQRLRSQDEYFDSLSDIEKLAIIHHQKFCHASHVDACGWEYEMEKGKHMWSGHAHKRHYDVAHRLHSKAIALGISTKAVMEIIKDC